MELYFNIRRKDGGRMTAVYADSMEVTLSDGREARLEWDRSGYTWKSDENGSQRAVECRGVSVTVGRDDAEIPLDSPAASILGIIDGLHNAELTYICGFDNEGDDSYDLLDEYELVNNELMMVSSLGKTYRIRLKSSGMI